MALRVASAYRTVSSAAVLVIAGLIPIHILASERAEIERAILDGQETQTAKAEARARSIIKWQMEWDGSKTGRWTHGLIPKVDAWYNRKWGQTDFHITQFLSGHGCFNEYLLRFKKRNDARCMYCDNPVDDVEHTFKCDR